MTTKNRLRSEIAQKRRALDPNWISTASTRIIEILQQLDEFQNASTIALYMAIAGEVDLNALFPVCWKQGMRTCVPVYNAGTKIYEMAEITSETGWKKGYHGILEPESFSFVGRDEIDLMIVPGVAFDPSGNRLGRGGGHYDRLLDGYAGCSMAVAFDFQMYSRVPSDARDIPVDIIVTETKSVKVQNEH